MRNVRKDIGDGLSCFLALIYSLLWVRLFTIFLRILLLLMLNYQSAWSKFKFILMADKIDFIEDTEIKK